MSLKKVFKLNETPDAQGKVFQLEDALYDALKAAGQCPGCWHEDARGGALADHDKNCREGLGFPEDDEDAEVDTSDLDAESDADQAAHPPPKDFGERPMKRSRGKPMYYIEVQTSDTSKIGTIPLDENGVIRYLVAMFDPDSEEHKELQPGHSITIKRR